MVAPSAVGYTGESRHSPSPTLSEVDLKRYRKYRLGIEAKINEIKESSPCADCGSFYPAVVMDFDHLPGSTKVGTIGSLKHRLGMDGLLEEISKCEIVCSNCHRIRTLARLMERQQSHTLSKSEFDSQASDQADLA
jgi:hypothetical protein